MGGEFSKDAHPLAVAAVAEITYLDQEQLRTFRDAIRWTRETNHGSEHTLEDAAVLIDSAYSIEGEELKRKQQQRRRRREPDLSYRAFKQAMEDADLYISDRAILDRMFTLMDKTGDDVIHAQSFSIGMALLLPGDLVIKLHAAFEALDTATHPVSPETRLVNHDQLIEVLTTLILVATFFGDPNVSTAAIRTIADSIFAVVLASAEAASPSDELSIAQTELVKSLAQHPLVMQYVDNAPQSA